MTATFDRLRRLTGPHRATRVGASVLGGIGAAAAIAAGGMWSARWPLAASAAWLAIAFAALVAVRVARVAARGLRPRTLVSLVERVAAVRPGSLSGTLGAASGSDALLTLADERAAAVVSGVTPRVQARLWADTKVYVARGTAVAGLGLGAFVLAAPSRGATAFWHPLRAFVDARAPIRLDLDRDHVSRGGSVEATIHAPAADAAILWVRGPGEPWRAITLALDSGRGSQRLGPLDADLFLRATSGSRTSIERRVTVALPAFLATLDLMAKFPRYLDRADEQLFPGPDTVSLAAGTAVLTSGATSVPLAQAAWIRQGTPAEVVPLACKGAAFVGRLAPSTSGVWRLALRTAQGAPVEGEDPELVLRMVPDSAPVVLVPVPGHDVALPLSLRQQFVIDAHDDHGITRVEIVSWRVSQTGKVEDPVHEPLLMGPASDRVLLEPILDATNRGLLPGDTLRVQVVAWDNAPRPQEGRSPEMALRLPSLTELRAASRTATRDLGDSVSALAQAATALADRTRDLAAQRPRGLAPNAPGAPGAAPAALPFEASERASAIADAQRELEERAQGLVRALDELSRAQTATGARDTVFAARLDEVRQLLQRALTPELAQRLQELQAAVARLDPQATGQALQNLQAAEQQFRQALERSRALFQRAAAEGDLTSLAADAEDLQRRQGYWNQNDGPRPDSAAAVRERALGVGADSLAQRIAQAGQDLAAAQDSGTALLDQSSASVERARAAMRDAAGAADIADAPNALGHGEAAESDLASIPGLLRGRRDSLAGAWRQQTLEALDRALGESVDLARREQAVVDSLHHGDTGPALRSRQASIEEGTAAIRDQIQQAAGRYALVSPQLDGMVGFAEREMSATRSELDDATPNAEAAASLAEQSVDALNATAYALVRTHGDVATARSGTGFAEAIAQLARLAQQQGALDAQTQGILPLPFGTGPGVGDQLSTLGAEQRALADQLERLRATGGSEAAGPLAQEARDLATQLEAGRLDPQTLERQDRLYHRLLDAGRTLSSPEPAQDRERLSQAAGGDSVHVPLPLRAGAAGAGPLVPYPTWDELRDLAPDERRLVLEYFQRLNAPPSR